MAARKQQDIFCMFCSSIPCSCSGVKKKPPVRKKLSTTPVPEIVIQLPEKLETPPALKPGISKLADTAQQQQDESDDHERAALTVLFKGGFILEPIGDRNGFESVRPKLNMTPIDISIQLWKIRRSQWIHSQPKTF